MEEKVRQATKLAISSWQNEEATCEAVHEDCAFWVVGPNDPQLISFHQSERPQTFIEKTATPEVTFVRILPVGGQSAAASRVQIGRKVGFVVLLLQDGSQWKAISVGLSPISENPVLSKHFQQVNELTWDGYCRASRKCDGEKMAEHFHANCRLTFTNPTTQQIQVIPAAKFYDMVTNRYTAVEPHLPFAHLQDEKSVEKGDSLQSIDFATSDLALVTLKVGHPPFLWTDLLTCAADADGRWWIVHKSSESEPFLLDEARHPKQVRTLYCMTK